VIAWLLVLKKKACGNGKYRNKGLFAIIEASV
jgi:hypothetical protein